MANKKTNTSNYGAGRSSGEAGTSSKDETLSGPGNPGSKLGSAGNDSFRFTATGTINLTGSETLSGPGDPGSRLGSAGNDSFRFTATGTINLVGEAPPVVDNMTISGPGDPGSKLGSGATKKKW